MARIIEISANEEPPLGADWVLVTSEGYRGAASDGPTEQHEMGATFLAPPSEPAFSDAVDRATAWADFHDVETVYVQRGRSML